MRCAVGDRGVSLDLFLSDKHNREYIVELLQAEKKEYDAKIDSTGRGSHIRMDEVCKIVMRKLGQPSAAYALQSRARNFKSLHRDLLEALIEHLKK